jgi:hypothetical protein
MNAKKSPQPTHWMVKLIIGFQALFILGFFIGLWLLYQDFSFYRRAASTQGEIVDIQTSSTVTTVRGAMPSRNNFPVFTFIDQNGAPQTVRSIVAMDGRFTVGETRTILFDPENPSARVELEGWQFYTGIGGIVLLVTAPITLLFAWGFIRQKRLKQQKRLRRNRKARERRARIKAEKKD